MAALADAALGDAGPADDVALLVVRAVPAPLEGRLPARGESMRVLRRTMAGWEAAAGLTPELAEDLELALGEAAANAAEHAYGRDGGEFAYSVARRADGDLEVSVRDHGRWRPVPEDNGHRGHGLRVIGQIAEDLRIERGDDGTHVRFRVPVPPPPVVPSRPVRVGARQAGERRRCASPATGSRCAATSTWPAATPVAPVLLGAAAAGRPLTVDLTEVGYLSSAGVALPTRRGSRRPCRSSWPRVRPRRGCAPSPGWPQCGAGTRGAR